MTTQHHILALCARMPPPRDGIMGPDNETHLQTPVQGAPRNRIDGIAVG